MFSSSCSPHQKELYKRFSSSCSVLQNIILIRRFSSCSTFCSSERTSYQKDLILFCSTEYYPHQNILIVLLIRKHITLFPLQDVLLYKRFSSCSTFCSSVLLIKTRSNCFPQTVHLSLIKLFPQNDTPQEEREHVFENTPLIKRLSTERNHPVLLISSERTLLQKMLIIILISSTRFTPLQNFLQNFLQNSSTELLTKLLTKLLIRRFSSSCFPKLLPKMVPQNDTSFRSPKRSSSCTQKDHEKILKKHSKRPQNIILLLDMPKSR